MNNNNFRDVEEVAQLIRNDCFHINLADGVSQKHLDNELVENLASEDAGIKAQAVFATIYNV